MDIQQIIQQLSQGNFNFRSKHIGTLVIVILAIITISTSLFMVDATEQAVVVRVGKYNRTKESGLNLKIPFGIERAYKVPTQIVQNMTFGFRTQSAGVVSTRARGDFSEESTMLTGDLNIVDVEWIIQYRIVDPRAWLFNVENRQKTISDISRSVINNLVGDYYITDILGSARTEIEEKAIIEMNEILSQYTLGINLTAVRLQNIEPPAGSVQDAFEDVNRAVQDMNRLINEGREEYNKEIPKARGQADQLIQIAQGYATERVNQAKGDTERFNAVLTEYNKNPTITRDRLYYETLEMIFEQQNDGRTQFIDKDFKNVVPFLPIQKNQNQGLSSAVDSTVQ